MGPRQFHRIFSVVDFSLPPRPEQFYLSGLSVRKLTKTNPEEHPVV